MKKVSTAKASFIIEKREPIGVFYIEDSNGKYIGIDNSRGDAWVEEFDDVETCRAWLNKEIEIRR